MSNAPIKPKRGPEGDFENSFQMVLNAQERKRKKEKSQTKASKPINFGNTEVGRTISNGTEIRTEHSALWNMRTIKGRGGAVKGRGPRGGIRK